MTSGSQLGPCEIVAKLGEGGMGEVYRAHDARLNRDVAVKVLPELFAALEESDGVGALVMELVEGEDLPAVIRSRTLGDSNG